MNKILSAAQFAAKAHAGQTRKYTGAPYITHPARVAARTMLLPDCTEAMACAAWLHDTIEDCGVRWGDLEIRFGEQAANLVQWLTNPSKGSEAPRDERKCIDREHIAAAPIEAQKIKLIDRIDNLIELPVIRWDNLPFCELYANESELLLQVIGHADDELAGTLRERIEAIRLSIEVARLTPATPVTL